MSNTIFFYSLRVFYKGATKSKLLLTKDFINKSDNNSDIYLILVFRYSYISYNLFSISK